VDFGLSLKVVFPLFFFMALGFFARRIGLGDAAFFKKLNRLAFSVFMSVSMFLNIVSSDLSAVMRPQLIGYCVGGVAVCFLLLMFAIPALFGRGVRSAEMIQSIYRSNCLVFGLSIVGQLYGAEHLGSMTLIAGILSPIYTIMAVIAFELNRGEKPKLKNAVIAMGKNPVVLAAILGTVCLICGLKLPVLIDDVLGDVAALSTPILLMTLGGTFEFSGLKQQPGRLAFSVAGRLLMVPAIFVCAAIALGFRGLDIVCILVDYAAPTALTSFPMAIELGGEGDFTGRVVVMTSACSILSLFFWVTLLGHFGLL